MAERKSRRKQRLQELTKQDIVDAVVAIIDREGIDRVTMSNVAREAGMAKGTVYLYFKDKNELLESVRQHSLEPLKIGIAEILDSDHKPPEKIRRTIRFHLNYFAKHRQFFRIMIYDHQLAQNKNCRYKDTQFQAFVQRMTETFRQGMEEGYFRSFSANSVAIMFIESLIGLINKYLFYEDDNDPEEDAHLLTEVFLNGLRDKDSSA